MGESAGANRSENATGRRDGVALLLTSAAALLFWSSVFGFAALRAGYSHATKAVSELGAWGAPNMWGFNGLGYILPGALLAAACWRVARRVRPKARAMPAVLAWSGLAITLAGLSPADMAHMGSLTSTLHIVGSTSGILAWIPGVIWLGIVSIRTQRTLATVCFASLALMVGAFSLYAFLLPGLVQRLCFAVLFGWGVAAASAVRAEPAQPAKRT